MKRLLLLILIVLSFNTILKAQNTATVSTDNISAVPGDTVTVPVNVTGFTNVGSLLIKLQYDMAVLQWFNQTQLNKQLSATAIKDSLGIITMQWNGQNALNIDSGKLVDLRFVYLGGTTQLTFLQDQSVVTDLLGNAISVSYINGSVALKNYTLTINKTGSGSGSVKVDNVTHTLPYSGSFPARSIVTLEAVADKNSTFINWRGDITRTTNPTQISMNNDRTVNANFTLNQFSLTINKTGNGQIKVNDTLRVLPYTGLYNTGTQVKLEAVPETGNLFSAWSGSLTGTANPVMVTVDTNKSITANFNAVVQFTLSLNRIGNGQIKVDDTLRTMPYIQKYTSGTQVKIEAVPDPGNIFTGWSGGFIGTTNPVVLAMNGDKTIDANFKVIQYDLTITRGGNGSGRLKVNGVIQVIPYSGAFNSGTQVTLEAVPDTGNVFSGWTGDFVGSNNPVTVTINNNMAITANYTIIKYALTIVSQGNGSGNVKINGTPQNLPFTGSFNFNTNITIEAVPDTNSKFIQWSGDLISTVNPALIKMDGNKSVNVNFNIIQYTLTLNRGGNGQVRVNGSFVTLPYSALYNKGMKIILEAVPDANNQFTGWSGDLTGKTNPSSITMNKDRVVTALFDVNIFSLTISKSGDGEGQIKVNGITQPLPYANTFSYGTQLILEAAAATGSTFTGWAGDLTGNTNPVTISITGNTNIFANFNIIIYSLTINKAGTGDGQVKVNGTLRPLPYSSSFNSGSDVTLEAIASEGSSFSNWSGDLNGNKSPNTISINNNKTITTNFSLNAPAIPVLSYPGNNNKYISPKNLTIKWTAVANVVSYHFQLTTDSSFSRLMLNDSSLTSPTITISSLQYKTKYYWRIRAKNPGGYSSFTQPWSFLTKIEAIGCPSNLQSITAGNKIELNWKDNSSNENGFQIFRKNGDSLSTKPYVNIGSVGKDATTYNDQYLNAGEIYTYLVYAYNSDTISCFSNQSSIQAITAVNDKQIPLKFELFQNYPNPFNPSTSIIFDLPSEMSVSLEVFDMLGRQVAILINNEIKSAGRYTIHFDGSRISSGEYFYMIRAGEFTAAKKFIILK